MELFKGKKNRIPQNVLNIFLGTVIPLIIFLVFRLWLFSGIDTLWWRDVLSAIVSGIVLVAYDSAIKQSELPKETIGWLLVVILIISLVWDYSGQGANYKELPKSETTTVLSLGKNSFFIKSGEVSDWLIFPDSIYVSYGIESSAKDFLDKARYKVFFRNGKSYYSYEDLPHTRHGAIRVMVIGEDQQIIIHVKKK